MRLDRVNSRLMLALQLIPIQQHSASARRLVSGQHFSERSSTCIACAAELKLALVVRIGVLILMACQRQGRAFARLCTVSKAVGALHPLLAGCVVCTAQYKFGTMCRALPEPHMLRRRGATPTTQEKLCGYGSHHNQVS